LQVRDLAQETLLIRASPLPAGAQSHSTDGDRADATRAAAGDLRAYERLYRTHLAKTYSLVRRMAGEEHADELTQDVFVRVWQKLGSFRGDSAFGTWLHRLAVNVVLEWMRSRRHERFRHQGDPEVVFQAMSGPPSRPDVTLDFEAAMERLPEGAREVFVLHDVEGHTHVEIGALLEISPGTSKAQLHRARMLMRRFLSQQGPARHLDDGNERREHDGSLG
jgi:RNA polymerase sigma-70 factor (ECF subfamily)